MKQYKVLARRTERVWFVDPAENNDRFQRPHLMLSLHIYEQICRQVLAVVHKTPQ